MTPEDKERQKKLEEEIATRIAKLNKWYGDDEVRWKEFTDSVKELIAEMDRKREAILHPKE